jgi:glycosyltransferase involved in cell wall biosynthesis
VLPYILGLAARGWEYTLVSFEKEHPLGLESKSELLEVLTSAGVSWVPLLYHARPQVLATTYDLIHGILKGLTLSGRGFDLVHARSTVPAAMAHTATRLLRVPWIFDLRGLVAEEYADAGHWRRDRLVFRVTNALERWLLRETDGLVVLAEAILGDLWKLGVPRAKPTAVIPCAADARVFRPSAAARATLRSRLALGTDPVLVYAGSLGGWNPISEMMAFFSAARDELPGLRFLVLTSQTEVAERAAESRGLRPVVIIRSPTPPEVPDLLAAADAGVAFRTGGVSTKAASPTKCGEYLASGLPVVTDSWTGDSARLRSARAWFTIERFDVHEYQRVGRLLREALRDPERTQAAALDLASREFGLGVALGRYEDLYCRVLLTSG